MIEFHQSQTTRYSIISYLFEKNLLSLRFVTIALYLVWFIFGLFGIHNFLLARYGLGLFQLIFATLGISIFPWGIPLLIVVGVIVLIDAFVIGAIVRQEYQKWQEENNGPRIINQ